MSIPSHIRGVGARLIKTALENPLKAPGAPSGNAASIPGLQPIKLPKVTNPVAPMSTLANQNMATQTLGKTPQDLFLPKIGADLAGELPDLLKQVLQHAPTVLSVPIAIDQAMAMHNPEHQPNETLQDVSSTLGMINNFAS